MHLIFDDLLVQILFVHQISLCFVSLLSKAGMLTHLTVLISFNVAATLVDNVIGTLPGLINFPDGLSFFLFKQTNTVTEQFEVLFCTFTRHLSGNQLLVQSCVIVLLVRCEVHLFISVGGFLSVRLVLLFLRHNFLWSKTRILN